MFSAVQWYSCSWTSLNIYFASIEKQVLTFYTNLSRFWFLGTTPVLALNVWANEKIPKLTPASGNRSGDLKIARPTLYLTFTDTTLNSEFNLWLINYFHRCDSRPTLVQTWKICYETCCKLILPKDLVTWKMESMISKITNGLLPQIGLPSTRRR